MNNRRLLVAVATCSIASSASFAGCPTDMDFDGVTGPNDLAALFFQWGACFDCPGDFDYDGHVDFDDLLTLLAAWGPCR